MGIYIIIALLIILLIGHFYYIYKLEDMNLDELMGFGLFMGVFVTDYTTRYSDSIFMLPSYYHQININNFGSKIANLIKLLKSIFEYDYVKIDGYSKLRLIRIKDSE